LRHSESARNLKGFEQRHQALELIHHTQAGATQGVCVFRYSHVCVLAANDCNLIELVQCYLAIRNDRNRRVRGVDIFCRIDLNVHLVASVPATIAITLYILSLTSARLFDFAFACAIRHILGAGSGGLRHGLGIRSIGRTCDILNRRIERKHAIDIAATVGAYDTIFEELCRTLVAIDRTRTI
jgi:hypothetical protein